MGHLCRLVSGVFTPKAQLRFAWANFIGSLILWPIGLIAFPSEPPLVMSLSFYAITITAMGYISAAQANVNTSDNSKE